MEDAIKEPLETFNNENEAYALLRLQTSPFHRLPHPASSPDTTNTVANIPDELI